MLCLAFSLACASATGSPHGRFAEPWAPGGRALDHLPLDLTYRAVYEPEMGGDQFRAVYYQIKAALLRGERRLDRLLPSQRRPCGRLFVYVRTYAGDHSPMGTESERFRAYIAMGAGGDLEACRCEGHLSCEAAPQSWEECIVVSPLRVGRGQSDCEGLPEDPADSSFDLIAHRGKTAVDLYLAAGGQVVPGVGELEPLPGEIVVDGYSLGKLYLEGLTISRTKRHAGPELVPEGLSFRLNLTESGQALWGEWEEDAGAIFYVLDEVSPPQARLGSRRR